MSTWSRPGRRPPGRRPTRAGGPACARSTRSRRPSTGRSTTRCRGRSTRPRGSVAPRRWRCTPEAAPSSCHQGRTGTVAPGQGRRSRRRRPRPAGGRLRRDPGGVGAHLDRRQGRLRRRLGSRSSGRPSGHGARGGNGRRSPHSCCGKTYSPQPIGNTSNGAANGVPEPLTGLPAMPSRNSRASKSSQPSPSM